MDGERRDRSPSPRTMGEPANGDWPGVGTPDVSPPS